ncbi:hypothetical protein C2S53_018666 [Perilla frutescens var. hirtella]|uniref:HXXXD-type acyl-transferase family protein n=1 Tax=Perilla frutescens var. hirtella TaxID=608512 RepID=A0AAD4JC21_PERFH|nr:hypothetical protein C2S53_018666 [Perilla frutescens var. hirtella]
MTKIEVMSSSVVGTTGNIASSISTLDLTTWDLRLLPSTYIQKGLIFHKPQSQDSFILHLKTSLSHTLDLFPPLAGRLATNAHHATMSRFFIDCNNAGAEFTHAVAAAISLSDILEPNYTPQIVSSFFPLNGVSNLQGVSTPLLAVQLTELADGIFVGCAANHAVVDGTSFWHFINSWSQISRGFDKISKPPVFERNDNNNNRLVHLPTLEQNLFAPSPALQKVFHFSKESVAKLKAKANSEASSDDDFKIKISSLQAVVAHLWRSVIRCRWLSDSESSEEEARMMMAVGARARMSLPDGYFGNAAYVATVAIGEGELLHKGLGYAALRINEVVSEQTKEAIMRDAEENPTLGGGLLGGRLPLIIGSSPRHDVYGNDFGWGKPIAVRSGEAHKHDGLVLVLPAAEGGGIDVEVCLAEETLEAMEYDADFMGAFITST